MIRLAIPDKDAVSAFNEIKKAVRTPLIADIHFDYRLAIATIEAGADKIRINPGNIGARWKTEAVIKKARDQGIPIRVGVNAGSIDKDILKRYGSASAEALIESIRRSIEIFKDQGFDDLVISAKAADAMPTVKAYQSIAVECDYPLHLGITEAGLPFKAGIKSAAGLAILLNQGIGDTLRVSLTGDPVLEVIAGYEILKALNLREHGPILISCPTCGRCEINLVHLAQQVEEHLNGMTKPIKVAVMGCSVNGPGEAKAADYGIAGGRGAGVVFKKGAIIKTVSEAQLVETLINEIKKDLS